MCIDWTSFFSRNNFFYRPEKFSSAETPPLQRGWCRPLEPKRYTYYLFFIFFIFVFSRCLCTANRHRGRLRRIHIILYMCMWFFYIIHNVYQHFPLSQRFRWRHFNVWYDALFLLRKPYSFWKYYCFFFLYMIKSLQHDVVFGK